MGDAYRALCVATRRPMRKWWRRVGSWWIAALVVLLGTQVWAIFYDYQWMQLAQQKIYTPITLFREIIRILDYFTVPLPILLWLLAALKASDLVTRLASDSASLGEGELRFLRFRLALAQGTIPVIAISLSYVLSYVMNSPLRLGDHLDIAYVLIWPGALADALDFIIPMLWVLLLVAFVQVKRWFVVAWCLVIYCLPYLYNFVLLLEIHLSINIISSNRAPIIFGLDLDKKTFILLCGLAYIYSIPWLLALRRTRLAVWLGAVYMIITPFSYLRIAPKSIVLSLIKAIGQNIEPAVTPIMLWARSHSIDGSGFAAVCDVYGYIFRWQTSFQMPVALTFLLLIVPIATFAAHYYALRWIMLNVKPAVPKQRRQGLV